MTIKCHVNYLRKKAFAAIRFVRFCKRSLNQYIRETVVKHIDKRCRLRRISTEKDTPLSRECYY